MKTYMLISIFCLYMYSNLWAELGPLHVSKTYSVKTGDVNLMPFGDGFLGVNYNYNYDYYNEWGQIIKQSPAEIVLFDSTLKAIKKIKFARIDRWNQHIEISKDGKNVFIYYQPERWNRSVAGGTVKFFCLNQQLTCTHICRFIIPGSRPSIQDIEKISKNHVVLQGTFYNRGNMFMYNVDLATGKLLKFKISRGHSLYFVKHFVVDGKTFLLSRDYNIPGDSLQLSAYTNTGLLLKRQWIFINEMYACDDISMTRLDKNKYVFYGQGYNKRLGDGHENYLYTMVYEKGKITKITIVNQSTLNFEARMDFSKVGLLPSNEDLRSRFADNRKKVRTYYHLRFDKTELLSNGNYYLYATLINNEVEGGVVIEFDKNFNEINSYTFPVVEKETVRPGEQNNYANGKCFVNANGFYYAYLVDGNLSGVFIDRNGAMSSFALKPIQPRTTTLISVSGSGFICTAVSSNVNAGKNEENTQYVSFINL